MVQDALDAVDTLLEDAIDDTEDSDVGYKLRSARQLVELAKQRLRAHDEDIIDEIDDDELLTTLRDLGYLE